MGEQCSFQVDCTVIGLRLAVCADIITFSLADGEDRGRGNQSDRAQWKAASQSLGQPVARDWLNARDSIFVLPAVVVEDRDGTARWVMCRENQQRTGNGNTNAKLFFVKCWSFYLICKDPQPQFSPFLVRDTLIRIQLWHAKSHDTKVVRHVGASLGETLLASWVHPVR